MAAIFYSEDVVKLLRNAFVVVIGDSNQRGVYKDLILLLQSNRYLTDKELKSKGVKTCLNDIQIEQSAMSNGVDYREVREYKTDYHWVRYYFVTRVNSPYMKSILKDLMDLIPDILIINSCIWDISRYGPHSMTAYKKNLEKTFQVLKMYFWDKCRVIWNTALPVSNKVKGGFLLPELSFICNSLNRDVVEGNYHACQLAEYHDFDVIDLHYMFKDLLHWRADDGIHWQMMAHRRISNIILTHICESWDVKTPRHNFEMFQPVSSRVGKKKRANQAPSSAPRAKIAKQFDFTELDDLPQYLDFGREPKLICPEISPCVNVSNPKLPAPTLISPGMRAPNPPKTNTQRIPPLMQIRTRQNSLRMPPPMPPQPRQGIFQQECLQSMRQFWQTYVAESYGYSHCNKQYDPRMFCQYPDLRAPRHAPYHYSNIMHSGRVEYIRRQQERIRIERRVAFGHIMR